MILEKGDDPRAAKQLSISWLAWEKEKHFFPNPYGFYAMLSLPIWLEGPPDIMGR